MNDGATIAPTTPGAVRRMAPSVVLRAITAAPAPASLKCTGCDARHASLCGAVPRAELARLSAAAVALAIPGGQRFIAEGERAENFFTLSHGTVKLFKTLPDGRQQIVSFAGPGDLLGLAVEQDYAYSAEAVDTVRLCRLSRPRLRRLVDEFPAIEARLLEITRHELVLAQEQMLLLGCKSAREKLASFLLQRAAGCDASASVTVALPMTRGDIGDYLGLRIETVCRMLTQLRADGLIEIVPGSTKVAPAVVIHDLAALRRVATAG
jgi:CRP/FNR family transcriptional regulator